MNAARCQREDELLDALGRGFVGDELESHVAGCTVCSELRVVAGALLDDRSQAMSEASVPSSGTMWWRMRVRHRQEVVLQARRSLLIGQAATVMIALGLVYSFFGGDIAAQARQLITTIRYTPLLFAAATAALLIPIAGWVAIRQK